MIEFAGTEEISRPYRFSILVSSDRDDLEIMDRGATFAIRGLAARSVLYRSTAGDGRPDNTIHTLVMEQTCLPR